MKTYQEMNLPEEDLSGDCSYTLDELLNLIPKLQKKYGKHALLSFDAGYYNVWATIIPTKKVKNNAVNVH